MTGTDNPFDGAITNLIMKIDERLKEIAEEKRMVNKLCSHAGIPPRYPDVESESAVGSLVFARDQFHAKPLATAVREYLERRGTSDKGGLGAATVNEIFEALSAGGYKPETDDDANAKRGLRIALSKNSQTFYRVPGGAYGLLAWYPNAKPQTDDTEPAHAKPRRGRPPKKKRTRQGRPPGVHGKTKEPDNVIDLTQDKSERTEGKAA